MRCWVVVPAVALLFLASVGKGDAVKLQGRKHDHLVKKKLPEIEPRTLEAEATSNAMEVPAPPAGKTAKLDPRTEAQLVGEAMMRAIPHEIDIPYLPLIEFMGLSLSLTNVKIQGMDNFEIQPTIMIGKDKAGKVTFPKLSLLADPYVAGGQLLNLPFVGKGAFNATVLGLTIHVMYHRLEGTTFCPTPNSTKFQISLERLIVKFEDLNPGTETGELINAMISGCGGDMMSILTLACNNESLLHPLADQITVAIIGKFCSHRSDATDPENERSEAGSVCSPQSSNSCGEENVGVEEEDSSSLARGVDFTDLRLSENIAQHYNKWSHLLTASLVDPIAKILENSFKLQ